MTTTTGGGGSGVGERVLVQLRRAATAVRYRALHLAWGRGVRLRSRLLDVPGADLAARVTGRRIVHCFGDSHAWVFRGVERRLLHRTWLDLTIVGGATALGLENPNSRTDALRIFRERISRLPLDRTLLFLLGEVDCGFLLWHKAEQSGVALDEVTDRSLGNYTRFLEGLLADGRHNLVVATVALPVIEDYAAWAVLGDRLSDVQATRSSVQASLDERTCLTKRYNARLREWAASNGCTMLDFEADITDPSTGRVRTEMINADPLDHHYDPRSFQGIVAAKLVEAGYS